MVYPVPTPIYGSFGPNDSTHRFMTQRQCPSFATVTARLEDDDTTLILTCDTKTITIPLQESSNPSLMAPRTIYKAGIWDDQVLVQDMGDEAAAFFQSIVDNDPECRVGDEGDQFATTSSVLYNNVRLVSHADNDRWTNAKFTPRAAKTWMGGNCPPVSLTDGYPVLIACQASLDEVNRRLQEAGKDPLPMNRFRPNLVIEGTTAFDEDNWKVISIGEQFFSIVKACPRCKQSCTDQITGKVSTEPVEIMKSFRALGKKSEDVFFAQNAIPLDGRGRTISVGAPVRVLQRGDPVYC